VSSAPKEIRARLGRRAPRVDYRELSYAEQTHASPHWIVRYAHEQRAKVAVEMALATGPAVVIDWGTGDGLVIERLLDASDGTLELLIAYEPGTNTDPLRDRLARHPLGARVRVCGTVDEVIEALAGRKIDVLACLGVLEHLPYAARQPYYDVARDHLAPGGCLLIDVPVEYGPALLVKEVARRLLKGRPPDYSTRELLRRAVGRTDPDPERFDRHGSSEFIASHSRFDH
jgi:SAM-dependent methyltransferase